MKKVLRSLLEDSGCSSISGEPIYEDVDDFSEQKSPLA